MKGTIALIVGLALLALLALVMFTATDNEIVWFLVPFGGLCRMIGGTWKKAVGRFLPPIAVGLAYWAFVGFNWLWIPIAVGVYMLVKTLPFTLKGDSVHESWINWVWIWVLGFLNGIVCLSLAIPLSAIWTGVFLALVPMVGYGMCGTLSNVKSTAKYFPWKMCEFVFGSSAMIPVAMLIDLIVV